MATHSSILAWEIPWTEEMMDYSPWGHKRVRHNSVTPWAIARQTLSMEFPRQECWSGLPFPPPGDLPDPGAKPASCALQADSLRLSQWENPNKNT